MPTTKSKKPIYYSILKGNPRVLADERDKKKFLDTVLQLQQGRKFSVYAFCLLDSSVHLLYRLPGGAWEELLEELWEEFRRYYRSTHGRELSKEEYGFTIRMRTNEEIRLVCRELHYLPVIHGYAARIQDYWWSSYHEYRNRYGWKNIEVRAMLKLFDHTEETARRKFFAFHRRYPAPFEAPDLKEPGAAERTAVTTGEMLKILLGSQEKNDKENGS